MIYLYGGCSISEYIKSACLYNTINEYFLQIKFSLFGVKIT